MWWRFTKKIRRHPTIHDGEIVHQACYGMGAAIIAIANRVVAQSSTGHGGGWQAESGTGLAEPINRTGVVALTDRRLLFFAKRFAIGTPRDLTAEWPLEQVADLTWGDDTLTLEFVDGSSAQLHVPSNQSPHQLIAAWKQTARQSQA